MKTSRSSSDTVSKPLGFSEWTDTDQLLGLIPWGLKKKKAVRSALTCCTQCWACWGKAKTHTILAALNKSLNSFVQNKDFDFEQHWEHRALWLEAKHKVLLSQCLHPSEGSGTVAAVTRGASWSSWGVPCWKRLQLVHFEFMLAAVCGHPVGTAMS